MLVWTHAHLTGAINIFETYFILLVGKTYHKTLDSYHLSISNDKYDCIEISLHLKNIDIIKRFYMPIMVLISRHVNSNTRQAK